MVLTEEQKQDIYPVASLEDSKIATEQNYYDINTVNVALKSAATGITDYENDNGIGNNPVDPIFSATISEKLYGLKATSTKGVTGLGITLKVMAGDRIDIFGKSYYQSSTTYNNTNSTVLTIANIISAFIGSPDNTGFITKGITSPAMEGMNAGLIPAGFIRGNDGSSSSAPKAYINYMFFDEAFKFAGGNFSRVGSSGTVKNHFDDAVLQNIPVPKNGYLYVYVSNESNDNVFFDNLQVFHDRGPILEETHYYPFGLTMAGISSKALAFGNPKNKRGYNGNEIQDKEFSDGSGLEFYDFNARTYDQQIGRFLQIDSLSDQGGQESLSPYHFGKNNPIRYNDPDGKCPMCLIPLLPAIGEALVAAATATIAYIAVDKNKENLNQLTNNISNSLNSTSEQVGSYTNKHESGKSYHGKGPQSRADQSAKEKEKTYNDPLASQDWTPAPNDAEAFKQEAERIRNDGGVENPNNYNKRNSPGEKELKKQDAQKANKTIVQPNTGSTIVNLTITTISIIANLFN